MRSISFEYLIDILKKLPGVSKKQAEKIAYHFVFSDVNQIDELVSQIKKVKNDFRFCQVCNNLTDYDICDICRNEERDESKLCIVTSSEELAKIESTNVFDGKYFVLNEEIDLRKNKRITEKTLNKLLNLINQRKVKEILMATNWTINGEATSVFLKKAINQVSDATIYRLAVGLPINSALDYADNLTLKNALINKTKY